MSLSTSDEFDGIDPNINTIRRPQSTCLVWSHKNFRHISDTRHFLHLSLHSRNILIRTKDRTSTFNRDYDLVTAQTFRLSWTKNGLRCRIRNQTFKRKPQRNHWIDTYNVFSPWSDYPHAGSTGTRQKKWRATNENNISPSILSSRVEIVAQGINNILINKRLWLWYQTFRISRFISKN